MKFVWHQYKFNVLTTNLLYEILKLRQNAFIIEQFCPYNDLDDYDKKATHLLAMHKNQLAAYCRIFKKDVYYKNYASIGRIAVANSFRGKNLGAALINNSIKTLKKQPIKIEAQCYLNGFYGKFGFKKVGKIYSLDGILHQIMTK